MGRRFLKNKVVGPVFMACSFEVLSKLPLNISFPISTKETVIIPR